MSEWAALCPCATQWPIPAPHSVHDSLSKHSKHTKELKCLILLFLNGECQMAMWHQSTRTVPGHLAELFHEERSDVFHWGVSEKLQMQLCLPQISWCNCNISSCPSTAKKNLCWNHAYLYVQMGGRWMLWLKLEIRPFVQNLEKDLSLF